ncbi:O-succinylbenzoate-CoA ligase [Sorangium cellulosum]|uniref:O-succinylbenzoate-CoA ligase n=1 Tax=Sorangium cellulosum TaxID=56 RepID=A0A2L0ERV8_SORCE|nr:AMP-binding protein [Sorangium cellulosum]AUX42033.1 O-succinylbenzoate-CoA ligase [Sorangium cellulosum]
MDGLSLIEAARDPGVAARTALVHGGAEADPPRDIDLPGLGFRPGDALTFGDLAPAVAATCARLARAGVGQGARVALVAPNALGTVIAIHALLALGAVLVPIHPRLTDGEARVLIDDARPDVVLREPELAALVGEAAAGLAARRDGAPRAAEAPGVRPPDPSGDLAIVYTSGTTGRPKGAVLPRRAFLAAAEGSAANLGVRDDDRWLLCLPLCHVGGLSIVTRCLLARRAVVLAPRFDPAAVLASILRDRATLLSVVPTMLLALLEADRDNVLARLRAALVGGAGAPARALDECARRGVPALTTYGLTEACSQVTVQRPRDPRAREPGSGAPISGVELRIGGAGSDGVGRVEIRGPVLFRGYFRGPERAPELPVDGAGWFSTGDLGALDAAGRLHVAARRTDLIVTGGENVYPAEVEQVLESCAGVAGAVVFGVPDERWGHVVAAAIVPDRAPPSGPSDGAPLPPALVEALAAAVAARLAPHKRPRRLCAAAALPLTAAGKLDRAGAAERFAAALAPFPAR